MKAFVVDDERLVRWFLERALRRWGYEVTSVTNINDALTAAGREDFDYDIVFTDLKMPEGNGAILVNQLCNMSRRPHIVVCSAYITPEMESDFRSRGVLTLKKPFKLNELEETLRKIA
ncbi:MAG TPA: response regulator [Nitrospirae bacterium]|nr:response regulator [Nitrospirota bacterium]